MVQDLESNASGNRQFLAYHTFNRYILVQFITMVVVILAVGYTLSYLDHYYTMEMIKDRIQKKSMELQAAVCKYDTDEYLGKRAATFEVTAELLRTAT